MNQKKLCFMFIFLVSILLVINNVYASGNTFLIKPNGNITNTIQLDPDFELSGNVNVEGGAIDFYVTDLDKKNVLLLYNSTIASDFKLSHNGTCIFHFKNLNETGDVKVVLKYDINPTEISPESWFDKGLDYKYFDKGGIITLCFTLLILLMFFVYRRFKNGEKSQSKNGKKEEEKNSDSLEFSFKKNIFKTLMYLAIVIGFWLALRVIALLLFNYLFTANYVYNQYEIFAIIAYALTINLAFTLLKNISEKNSLENIFYAAIQSVLIGIIVLLPRYGSSETISIIGGGFNFALLLITMSILLAVLVIVRKYFIK